jgi:hypothetical protein
MSITVRQTQSIVADTANICIVFALQQRTRLYREVEIRPGRDSRRGSLAWYDGTIKSFADQNFSNCRLKARTPNAAGDGGGVGSSCKRHV